MLNGEINVNELQNKIYGAIISECERLEHDGVYKGNGHHLAQRLTAMIIDKIEIEGKKNEKDKVHSQNL